MSLSTSNNVVRRPKISVAMTNKKMWMNVNMVMMMTMMLSMVCSSSFFSSSSSSSTNYVFVEAFSVPPTMKYKPPVQTSVSKLRNSRFGGLRPTGGNQPTQTKTSKQAAASFVNVPQDIATSSPQSSSSSSLSTSTTPTPKPRSFEERMRGLVLGNRRNSKKQDEQTRRKIPRNVHTVETLQDFKLIVGEESSKIVAVRFFAPWCRACKVMQPLFYRMAHKFPNVVFVDVPVTDENTNLHQGLGVTSLPFGHIYHPSGGLVEESRFTRKHLSDFARKLQSYVAGSCELQGVGDATCPYPPINEGEDSDESTTKNRRS